MLIADSPNWRLLKEVELGALKNLTGQRFGRLVVVERAENYVSPKGYTKAQWLCKCDCGNEIVVISNDLVRGKTKSCGCLHDEMSGNRLSKLNKRRNVYDLSGEYGVGYDYKGREFYFDLEDYDLIKDYCWITANDGYIKATAHYDDEYGNDQKYTVLMHRLIMNPENNRVYVDHICGENTKNDNRKYNLRLATPSQNNMNKKIQSNNTSGVAGVYWANSKSKWCACITVNKKKFHLGYYDNFEDAVKARKEAEEKYFGEYAYDTSQNLTG